MQHLKVLVWSDISFHLWIFYIVNPLLLEREHAPFPSNKVWFMYFAYLLTRKTIAIMLTIWKHNETASVPMSPKTVIRNGHNLFAPSWQIERVSFVVTVVVVNSYFRWRCPVPRSNHRNRQTCSNIILLGRKENWQTCPGKKVGDYFSILYI